MVSSSTAAASQPGPVTGDLVGQSVLRKEDLPLLTGTACFIDDIHRPGMLHAAVLRSPHAHARLLDIDPRAARAAPGVTGVVTAADLPDRGPEIPMRMFRRPGMERFLQPV